MGAQRGGGARREPSATTSAIGGRSRNGRLTGFCLRRALVASGFALLLGCGGVRVAPHDVPAVIERPTKESRAELRAVVSHALDGKPVTLADDALTTTNLLLVDRARHRDAADLPVEGRQAGRPERFLLVKSGRDCVLVHERTGRRFELPHTGCKPR